MSNNMIPERAPKKMHCPFCDHSGAHIEERETDAYPHSEKVVLKSKVMVCNNCHRPLYCEPLDDATFLKSIYLIEDKSNKLFPQEIRDIRAQLKLSQKSFNKLIGWPDDTVQKYEYEKVSTIPDEHLKLLRDLQNPDLAKEVYNKNKSRLPDKRCENCVFWKWYGDDCICNDTYDDYADYEEYDSEGECYGWIKEE